ncbi:MAG: LysE family translocator, partial [Pseudomonadota bacterium]
SPGPNMAATCSRGLGTGRLSALAVAAGISIGAFFWALLTASGVGALFQANPDLYRLMSLIGGGYLTWLGMKGWRAALTSHPGEIAPHKGQGIAADLVYGLLVTATNPKVALLWVSLSIFVSEATASLAYRLLFATGSSCVVFVIYSGYGLVFSTGRIRTVYQRFQRTSEALFGTIFLALGLAMMIGVL